MDTIRPANRNDPQDLYRYLIEKLSRWYGVDSETLSCIESLYNHAKRKKESEGK